jgi:hypothetical protein
MSTWDIVTTVKAPSEIIHRFLAFHLSVGVNHIYLFLDAPNDPELLDLQAHKQVSIFRCDQSYWAEELQRDRPEAHPRRQIVNATYAYGISDAEWIAHIDIDEFLIPSRPIHELLSEISPETMALRVAPAELLDNPTDDKTLHAFKFPVHWKQRSGPLLRELYPTFGEYLKTGLISRPKPDIHETCHEWPVSAPSDCTFSWPQTACRDCSESLVTEELAYRSPSVERGSQRAEGRDLRP